jgi:hypothetical protein
MASELSFTKLTSLTAWHVVALRVVVVFRSLELGSYDQSARCTLRQVTWNFECFESIQTLATASPNGWLRTQLRSIGFHRTPLSQGVVVLNKCANPVCSAQFRYLHQGKLFEVEVQYAESLTSDGQTKTGKGKGHAERCWLCDECAAHITLRFDSRRGVVIVSSLTGSEEALTTAFSQSNGGTAAGIARVLVRRLDLDPDLTVSTRRRSAIKLNVRRSEAA